MLWCSLVHAQDVKVDGGAATVDGRVVVPAAVTSAVVAQGRLYVLTSAGSIETWQVEPPLRLAAVPNPDATRLFVADGRAWVEVREPRAQLVDRLVPVAAAVSTPAAVAVPEARSGKVVRTDNGAVVIDLGRKGGLTAGSEVRIFGTTLVSGPSLDGGGTESRTVEKVVATGRVKLTEDDRSLVELARGGRVEVGDRVEVREGSARYPVAPDRFGGVREAGVVLRPVLPLDTVGVAFVNDAWATWAFEAPWYATVRLAPFGFGWSKDGNPLTVAGTLSGGYDSRYFSVGLGGGWSMYNGDLSVTSREYATAADGGATVEFESVKDTVAVVQEARLGARDGLSLSVRNTFLLVPEYTTTETTDEDGNVVVDDNGYPTYTTKRTGNSFTYGGLAMRLNVPTGERTDLFADWSFGDAGFIAVEGGVSTWLRGNGDRGSVGLQVGAGYGAVTGQADDEAVTLGGPMVSVGARYRF
jgi:hypothetical protein